MVTTETPELLSVAEAAAILRLSERTIYNHCRDGKIKHIRLGDRILIKRQFIDDLLSVDEPW